MTSIAAQPVLISSELATFASHLPNTRGQTFKNAKVARDSYSDGTVLYRCLECGFSRPRYMQVVPHLSTHVERKPRVAPAATTPDVLCDIASQLVALANNIDGQAQPASDALRTERDNWKQRALAAERRLASLRRALGVTDTA